jgi:hypothetical protein
MTRTKRGLAHRIDVVVFDGLRSIYLRLLGGIAA